MEFTYNGAVCSDMNLVKNFVDSILNKLNSTIDNSDAIFDIRLIINELIINGVFHGNKCIDSKSVSLMIKVEDHKIIIQVQDEGEGIEYDIQSYDPTELKCSGRGLVLVHGLSDEIIVKDNRITAIKYI